MTTTVYDAITGEPTTVRPHNKWVLLNTGSDDLYLTLSGARQLAAQLLNATDTITEGQK